MFKYVRKLLKKCLGCPSKYLPNHDCKAHKKVILIQRRLGRYATKKRFATLILFTYIITHLLDLDQKDLVLKGKPFFD